MPTEIVAERDRLPEGLLEEIVEAGAYERAYAMHEADPKATGGLIDDVILIEYEQEQKRREEAKRKEDAQT